MICLIALIVFGVLGIFSATHRQLAKEAFDCVFKKLTFRKCETGLDTRLKSKVTGKLIRKSPKIARLVYKHFEVLSWSFIILFTLSTVYVGIGGYNYYLYGNCNGPSEEGFCIFDPSGENTKTTALQNEKSCPLHPPNPKDLTLANVDLSSFPVYDRDAENSVVFIGCYACPYTREAYPTIRKLLEKDDVNFIFVHFPVKGETDYLSTILNAVYQMDKQKFIRFNDELFNLDPLLIKDKNAINEIIEDIGLNPQIVLEYAQSDEIVSLTNKQNEELQKMGIYGTPTVFVNEKAVVGPKPYRVYKRLLK